VLGIVDDIRPLRVRTKLIGQLTAALICSLFGYTIQAVGIPFVGSVQLGPFGTFLFLVWVLGITNAVNLIDGLDGLASVVCFFAAVGNGIIAISSGNVYIGFFSFLLAGSLVGFLFHNFPPAKIFLGDTGSMLLGFLLSVSVLESGAQKRSTTLMVFAPLMLLAFSLLDVLLSIIRRFLRGKPIFSSDLGHIHHRLISRFNNPRRVLLVVSTFSMFAMLVALGTHFTQKTSPLLFWLSIVAAVAGLGLFVRLLGYFRIERIRSVLSNREGIKFFVAVMGYLRGSLSQCNGTIALLGELDWVCRALKPQQVSVRDAAGDLLYSYTAEDYATHDSERLSNSLQTHGYSFEWSYVSDSVDPAMCDVRLLWRELFELFGKELSAHPPSADELSSLPARTGDSSHALGSTGEFFS